MKKILSKALSVIVFMTMILPSTGTVFAAGEVSRIDVVNNAGMPDTVKVTGLEVGDTVKVYSITQPELIPNFNSKIPSGSSQVSQPGLSVNALAARNTPLGYRCPATEPGSGNIIYAVPPVINPFTPGIPATMVYGTVTVIGTATAKSDKVGKGASPSVSATVNAEFPIAPGSVYGLDRKAGSLYVSVTRKGMHESIPTEVEYSAEQRTPKTYVKVETPVNNAGIPDTVKVTGLEVGDIVKVYATPIQSVDAPPSTEPVIITKGLLTGSLLDQLKAAHDSAELKYLYRRQCAGQGMEVGQFPFLNTYDDGHTALMNNKTILSNNIYYNYGDLLDLAERSDNLTKDSATNPSSQAAAAAMLKVAVDAIRSFYVNIAKFETDNNYFVKDASVGALLGTGNAKIEKVAKGTTPTVSATVSIPQLSKGKGSIFVSVTRKTFLESDKIGKTLDNKTEGTSYGPETPTIMPSSVVTIVNNAVLPDIVTVENLKVGDIVNVYLSDEFGNITSPSKGTIAAKANKAVKGSIATATATVSIPQLLQEGGFICVTVTSKTFLESAPSQVIKFEKEGQTQAPKRID